MPTIDDEYVKFPENKIRIEHRNKKISAGAGIGIRIKKSDTPEHLCFEVIMFFNEIDYSILFEKICVKIQPEWKNSSQLLEIAKEIHSEDFSKKAFFESFLLSSLHFIVEIKENNLLFYVSAHAPSTRQNYMDFSKSTTKHNHDVIGWLHDIE